MTKNPEAPAPIRRVLRRSLTVTDQHSLPAGPVVLVQRDRSYGWRPHDAGQIEVWVEATTPEGWPAVPGQGEPRAVQVFGTGHPIPDGAIWLGSCLDGSLVWHLYDITVAIGSPK